MYDTQVQALQVITSSKYKCLILGFGLNKQIIRLNLPELWRIPDRRADITRLNAQAELRKASHRIHVQPKRATDKSYLVSTYRFCASKMNGRAPAKAWRWKTCYLYLLTLSMAKNVVTNILEMVTKSDISFLEALFLGLKSFHGKDSFYSKSINYQDRSLPYTLGTFSSVAACSLLPSVCRMSVCEPAFARSIHAFPFVPYLNMSKGKWVTWSRVSGINAATSRMRRLKVFKVHFNSDYRILEMCKAEFQTAQTMERVDFSSHVNAGWCTSCIISWL